MPSKTYYCDMDGVLADFNNEPNAIQRFKIEKDFFYTLRPIDENIQGIKELIKKGGNVKILSTSPHFHADLSKTKWLEQHLPEIKKENIIFTRPHQEKIDYIPKKERKNSILFDDYGKNVREWVKNGGRYAIKILEKRPIEENMKKVFQVSSVKNYLELK